MSPFSIQHYNVVKQIMYYFTLIITTTIAQLYGEYSELSMPAWLAQYWFSGRSPWLELWSRSIPNHLNMLAHINIQCIYEGRRRKDTLKKSNLNLHNAEIKD